MQTTPDLNNQQSTSLAFRSWSAHIYAEFHTELEFDASGLVVIEFESGEVIRLQIVESDCLYHHQAAQELKGLDSSAKPSIKRIEASISYSQV